MSPYNAKNTAFFLRDDLKAEGSATTIEKLNEELREQRQQLEAARLLAICLEDSDDENPEIKQTEASRKAYQPYIERLLRERNFLGRLFWKRKRSPNSSSVQKREVLKGQMQSWTETYQTTTNSRSKYNISSYGFGHTTTVSHSKITPEIKWTVSFKLIPKLKEDGVYSALEYDEMQCFKWWKRKDVITDGWSDLRKLARKVVFVLEKIHSFKLESFRNLQHLIIIGERSREITFFLLMMISTFPEKNNNILIILEYAIPLFFLLSRIVDASMTINETCPNGVIEHERNSRQLRLIDSCIRELRLACYVLGLELKFNAHDYMADLDDLLLPEVDEKSKDFSTIVLLGCLTGDKEQRVQMIENLRVNQLKVEQASLIPDMLPGIDILDSSELVKAGLERIDVIDKASVLKGEGGYAIVYEMERSDKIVRVAVKVFNNGSGAHRRIMREALTWHNLKHEQILPLLGFTTLLWSAQPCLVSKLCWGNLKDYVKYRAANTPLAVKRKLQFIRDVIYGLDYLHGQNIAHGDLRAVNVLVTEDSDDESISSAVLNDFGMSDDTNQNQNRLVNLTSVNQRTNDCWISPELMQRTTQNGIKSRVSKAGDIYALGVVFLEVVGEKDPYEDCPQYIQIAKIKGEPPARRENVQLDDSHWSFMENCWKDETNRWDIAQVGANLLRLI